MKSGMVFSIEMAKINMTKEQLEWQTFLDFIVSKCQIEGAPKSIFMLRFSASWPGNSNGCRPSMPKRGDDGYENQAGHMSVVYKKFEASGWIVFPKKDNKKAQKVLDWLWAEYENPQYTNWKLMYSDNGDNASKLNEFLKNLNYYEQ